MSKVATGLLVLLTAVIGFAASGCGSSSSQTQTVAESTATEAPAKGVAVEPLDGIAERLEAAGLTTYNTEPAEATDALKVGGIEVLYFADPRDAAVTGAEIGNIAANHPNNGLSKRIANIVVWTANQNGLSQSERDRFAEVVEVVSEGPTP